MKLFPAFGTIHLFEVTMKLPFHKHSFAASIVFGIALLFGTASAFGQNARINGRVSDPSGAALPGATIVVTNTGTAQSRTVVTGNSGDYDLPSLPPGTYTLHATHDGFQQIDRSGLVLDVDRSARVDLTLPIGSSSETVNVTTGTPLLQLDNAALETTITEKQFSDLPLIQSNRLRNPASFVYLAPGVQGNIRLDGNEYTGATNVISVNGGPIWNTELLLEGLPSGQSRIVGSQTESAPQVDAVRDFSITTTLLSADYGHTGFAVGSFGIKSGTKDFHGSIFEYFRNTALNAANWFAKYQNSPVAVNPTHLNEFGVTLGGPVSIPHLFPSHNTFFFFAYTGSRFTGATAYTTSTIASAQDVRPITSGPYAGYYNFTDIASPIYDPATTKANPSGAGYVRSRFKDPVTGLAANYIPASRVDPIALAILNQYYPVAVNGQTMPGAFTGDTLLSPDVYTGKIDQDITAKHHLALTYLHTSIPRNNLGSSLPISISPGYHQVVAGTTARINETWILSPVLVNNAYIGYNRFSNVQTPLGAGPNFPQQIGLAGIGGMSFPTMSVTGIATFGNITISNKTENDFYYKDIVSLLKGRHNLRVGGEYRAIQFNDLSPSQTTGAFNFRTTETGNPQSQSGTGYAFASFLLGQVDSGTITNPLKLYTRKRYWGVFVQDDWKATPRLTLNLGLRFEAQQAPTEAQNHQSIVSLTTPNPGAGNLPGALIFAGPGGTGTANLYPTDDSALGPRFGFTFQAAKTTVIRGGYGVYYSEVLPNTDIVNAGFSAQGAFSNTTSGIYPVFTLASGVPNYTATPTLTPTYLNGATGSYYAPGVGAMPRTQNYSLTVQQQLGKNTTIEFAYVGDRNTRQVAPNMSNINQLDPQYLRFGSAVLSSPATAANLAKIGATLPYASFTGTIAQALRPFPQYSTLTSLAAKVGASTYNSGQVIFKQRLTHGVRVDANYTWSKIMGYASTTLEGNSGNDNTVQNAYNPQTEYSLLPQDVHQALVMNYGYELPFGHDKAFLNHSRVGNILAGGWLVSAIQRYQSGFPLALTVGSNALPLFNRYQRPNLAPGVDPSSHVSNGNYQPLTSNIFNFTAFSAPGNASFGNMAPAQANLKNFPVLAEDMQLTKSTVLFDRVTWHFYAQAFNVFNRHRFAGFGTALGTSAFGKASATSAARALQFGTRFEF